MLEAKDALDVSELRKTSTAASHGYSEPDMETKDTETPETSGFIEDEDRHFSWRDVGILGWICTFAFWVLAMVVFYQFFTRYFLNDSAVWTEEIARNILIVLTFFGSALALQRKAHISVNFFVTRLSPTLQRGVIWLNALLQSTFFAGAVYLALKVAKATQFQKLMAVDLSKSVIYQSVALAFAIMLLIELYRAWQLFKGTSNTQNNEGGQP
ncbi:TRAP transporter small permease [Parasalinivibrio latis]|uniref:TRAP transporter small permease n=1 Tax=Parasalinivibrio latis TaxID=2952610 RepID=UPI0030DEEC0B